MVFSSISFLSGFLAVVFLLYTVIPNIHVKNALLIIFSLLFYAVGEPVYVLLMIGSAFANYIFGLIIGKTREKGKKAVLPLVAVIILNLGVLILFKYTDFFIGICNSVFNTDIPKLNLVMPIGISFFTFQAMSYVIDVYRGVCGKQKSFFKILLYISFFPQLIAGPIIKYSDMEGEINERKQTIDDVEYGVRRFIVGLSKKVLISNAVAAVVDTLYGTLGGLTIAGAWVITVGYSLQIYYDFSGYSDMAIGLGRMFGFHFKENFRHPYSAVSIKDFWRKWHISLSSWFKEYVYIPLGGNRKGKLRTLVNKYIVFFLTGLWHGANWTFIVWGLLHGTFSVLEESSFFRIEKVKVVRRIYALLVVMCAFVIFRADTLKDGIYILGKLFDFGTVGGNGNVTLLGCLTPYTIAAFALGIVFAFPWWEKVRELLLKTEKSKNIWHVMGGVMLLVCLLFCMVRLASDAYNPFIYFRF
jgi:alginate O-acetyltransferase complex protein AlgI